MANLSDLKLRNTAGSTVSEYSLIEAHAQAIEAINNDYSVAVITDFVEGDAHTEGELTVYAGEIYSANSDIVEDTVFVEGVGANNWTKIATLDKVSKLVVSAPASDTTYSAVNKTKYLINTTADIAQVALPLSSENAGMVVFVKWTGGAEELTIGTLNGDEIDGVDTYANAFQFATVGDFMEVIATPSNGWLSTYKYAAYVAP